MRIMCLPDLHCWYETHSRVVNGTPTRLSDWRKTADDVVAIAQTHQPDLILAPGDMFVTGNPPVEAILEVARLFERLEKVAPVIGCQGNHDPEGWNKPGPVDLLQHLSKRGRWGYTQPGWVTVPTKHGYADVAVLPWTRPDALRMGAENQVGNVQAALSHITWALAAQLPERQPGRVRILMGHWAVSGCQTANLAVLEGREPCLQLADLQAQGWDAVVMGHIHVPQQFPGTPVVIHTGALECRDFGEENDRRVVALIDTEEQTVEWVPYWYRRFWTLRLHPAQVQSMTDPANAGKELVMDLSAAEDKICRIVYQATEEQHARMPNDQLIRALYTAGAHHVAGVYPEIIRATRARSEGLTERTSPREALQAWLAQRADLTDTMRAAVLSAADELEREVLGCVRW